MPRDFRNLGLPAACSPLQTRMAPKGILKLSPIEMTYGRPFLTSDLLFDEETHQLVSHIEAKLKGPSKNKETKCCLPPTKEKVEVSSQSGDSVLQKTWKERSPEDQLQPKWKG